MPDDSPRRDAEATARAEADPMGLGVLDAVDVGGTWTVPGEDEVREAHEEPAGAPGERERRSYRWMLWAGGATAVAAVLVIAAAISLELPGPLPGGAPPAPPAAAPTVNEQPGIAPTPGAVVRAPRAAMPAGQARPTAFTTAPTPSASGPPAPSESPTGEPAPSPSVTAVPPPIQISPSVVPLPVPSVLPVGG